MWIDWTKFHDAFAIKKQTIYIASFIYDKSGVEKKKNRWMEQRGAKDTQQPSQFKTKKKQEMIINK